MAITPLKALLFLAGASGAATGTAYVAGAFDPYLDAAPPAVTDAKAPAPAAESAAAKPADAATQPPSSAPEQAADAKPAVAPEQVAAVTPQPEKPSVSAPAPNPPAFDLVRVEPDGSVVIAGSAMPNSTVEVVAGDKVIAKVEAGPSGAFAAILDEPLKPGDYQITLRASSPENPPLNSAETAVVSVPQTPDGQVLALVEKPGAPSRLITVPAAAQPAPPAPEVAAAPEAKPADVAAVAPAPANPPPAASPENLASADVGVDAIEIEGRKIFVAGPAPKGKTVRVYANELLLGETRASAEGRYLIEAERDLAVGDYIVRADVVGADGQVTARAAVPFSREAGESVAAVAPSVPDAPVEAPAQPAGQAAATPPAAAEPAPAAAAQPDVAAAPAAPAEPQQSAAAQPVEQPGSATAPPTAPPAGATAPKLEPVTTGVIIRRGDSLWRISKRVYGRGMRYSTIYLANKDQIVNPNRIWPGQIFRVPEKTEVGESADMKAIGEQATKVE